MPGRTCLGSTASKGGKSKSWRRGLDSMEMESSMSEAESEEQE